MANTNMYYESPSPSAPSLDVPCLSAKAFILSTFQDVANPNPNLINTNTYNIHQDQHKLQQLQLLQQRWKNQLSDAWKSDPDIALSALQFGVCRHWHELPDLLRYNRAFMVRALSKTPQIWCLLEEPYCRDVELVFAISNLSERLLGHILQKLPHLRGSVDLWNLHLKTLSQQEQHQQHRSPSVTTGRTVCSVRATLQEHAPANIRAHRQLMLQACQLDIGCLPLVDERLLLEGNNTKQQQPSFSFLYSVLQSHQWQIQVEHIPKHIQQQHPELMMRLFTEILQKHQHQPSPLVSSLYCHLSRTLWHDRTAVEQWLMAGGPFLERRFPNHYQDDDQLFLLLAQYCRVPSRLESFRCASPRLLHDPSFLKRALALNPHVWFHMAPSWRNDFDLLVTALAYDCNNSSKSCMAQRWLQLYPEVARQFEDWMKQQLRAHFIFATTVLRSVEGGAPTMKGTTAALRCADDAEATVSASSPLTLLNWGPTTVCRAVQLVAAYADVPLGPELHLLQRAQFHWNRMVDTIPKK